MSTVFLIAENVVPLCFCIKLIVSELLYRNMKARRDSRLLSNGLISTSAATDTYAIIEELMENGFAMSSAQSLCSEDEQSN